MCFDSFFLYNCNHSIKCYISNKHSSGRFSDSNLHEEYFCYNCIYGINTSGGKCMLVKDEGPDGTWTCYVIAPHGCCAGYEANFDRLHDTRSLSDVSAGASLDTEKNKEKITTADVT